MDKRVTIGQANRRTHDEAFKRELVERSLKPGASVSAIALDNGINANLLFNWRRHQMRRGGSVAAVSAALVPVTVEEQVAPTTTTPSARSMRAPSGVIEIDIGSARVRVRGVVDEATVRSVLRTLRAA